MGGIMRKAGRGLGEGLAMVGKMQLEQQNLEKLERLRSVNQLDRDKLLADYQSRHIGQEIEGRLEGIGMQTESAEGMQREALNSQADMQKAEFDFKGEQAALDRSFQQAMQKSEHGLKKELQLNQNAFTAEEAQLDREVKERIAQLAADTDSAIAQYKNAFEMTKFIDGRIDMYKGFVNDQFGKGYLEQLGKDERLEFNFLIMTGADYVRAGNDPEAVYKWAKNTWEKKRRGIDIDEQVGLMAPTRPKDSTNEFDAIIKAK